MAIAVGFDNYWKAIPNDAICRCGHPKVEHSVWPDLSTPCTHSDGKWMHCSCTEFKRTLPCRCEIKGV
jgi:hypothetical protein